MSDTDSAPPQHVFSGITRPVFDCVRATSLAKYGTQYTPPDADSGSTHTYYRDVTVDTDFQFDESAQTLTYQLLKHTFPSTVAEVWNGIQDTVNGCQGS